MSEQKRIKRIAIYPLLASGHTNVCITIAKLLLKKYPGQVEITFITDNPWKERLSKFDSRFKFRTYEFEKAGDEKHVELFMDKLEAITRLPLVERMGSLWTEFDESDALSFDKKCGDIMCDMKPDLILMDQMYLMPSVMRANVPYAYIISSNPLTANISVEYPAIGSDAYVSDKDKIREFRKGLAPYVDRLRDKQRKNFKEMGVEFVDNENLIRPVCDNFSVYCFPKEIDYYTDEVKKEFNLISFDTPLIPERLPQQKFELPEHFKGHKIVYVSLGSMFSQYTHLIQRLVDILATLPNYKYIVSKGPRGDALKLPNDNFIGENYINQLAVLQVCDVMIAHGGNNTLGECFYFGVPCIIMPVFVDQISNGSRIQETGYGYNLPIYDYTDDQLKNALTNLINDENIKSKWRKASERIQKDKNYNEAIDYIFNSIQ